MLKGYKYSWLSLGVLALPSSIKSSVKGFLTVKLPLQGSAKIFLSLKKNVDHLRGKSEQFREIIKSPASVPPKTNYHMETNGMGRLVWIDWKLLYL